MLLVLQRRIKETNCDSTFTMALLSMGLYSPFTVNKEAKSIS